jgi:hypothetical protein
MSVEHRTRLVVRPRPSTCVVTHSPAPQCESARRYPVDRVAPRSVQGWSARRRPVPARVFRLANLLPRGWRAPERVGTFHPRWAPPGRAVCCAIRSPVRRSRRARCGRVTPLGETVDVVSTWVSPRAQGDKSPSFPEPHSSTGDGADSPYRPHACGKKMWNPGEHGELQVAQNERPGARIGSPHLTVVDAARGRNNLQRQVESAESCGFAM